MGALLRGVAALALVAAALWGGAVLTFSAGLALAAWRR